MKAGRIVALVIGCVVALIGAALLVGTGALAWAYTTQRDDDGYFTSPQVRIETVTAAVHSEHIDLGSDKRPDRWPFGNGDLATVKLRATAREGEQVFIGIAHASDVDSYLTGIAHDEVTNIRWSTRQRDHLPARQRRGESNPADRSDVLGCRGQRTWPADRHMGCSRRRLVNRGDEPGRQLSCCRRHRRGRQGPRPRRVDDRPRYRVLGTARQCCGADRVRHPQDNRRGRHPRRTTSDHKSLTGSAYRHARRTVEPRTVVGEMVPCDPTLLHPRVLVDRLRRDDVHCWSRHSLHPSLPQVDLRLQRRRAALVVASDVLRDVGHRYGSVPTVHPRRRRLPSDARDRVPTAVEPLARAGQVVAARRYRTTSSSASSWAAAGSSATTTDEPQLGSV